MQTKSIRTLQDLLKEKKITADQALLLSITVDPKQDTPQVLREYADKYGADKDQWLFLTGDPDYLQRVAGEIYQVTYERQTHVERIILVDKWGQIRGLYRWYDPTDFAILQQKLVELIAETEKPPLDPATKYVLLHTAFPISPKPPGADLGKPPVFQPVEMPGIVSHSIIAGDDHSDGAGLAVYTWLRIQKGLEPMPAYAMMMAVLGAPQASGTDADDLLPIPGGPLPTMVTDEKVVQKILAPEGFAAGVSGFPYVTIVRLPRVLWGAPVPPGPR